LKDIITHLVTRSIVVVDITDLNPNVFWELGVRQSFKHGTVVIGEVGTEAPFDIFAKSVLFYHPKNHLENAKFTKDFKDALKDCLDNPTRPDSNVLETISGRGTLFEIFCRDEAIRRLDALLSEIDINTRAADEVYDRIDRNVAENKTTTKLVRFNTSSIELLRTERYLEVDTTFYDNLANYLGNIQIGNEVLARWDTQFKQATEKLLEIRPLVIDSLKIIKEEVQKARSGLVSKIC